MTTSVEVAPGVFVPLKCAGSTTAAGVPANPCREPGSLPRCELCPASPTYWRHTETAEGIKP